METLDKLFAFLDRVTSIRREAVAAYLAGIQTQDRVTALRRALAAMTNLPRPAGSAGSPGSPDEYDRQLDAGNRTVTVTLDYEFGELAKDIVFLDQGEDALKERMEFQRPGFGAEVKELADYLGGENFDVFLTDRDGTVNNYCGRYRSSHQGAYNAICLSRFIRASTDRAVILTSAPLDDSGILALTAMPDGAVCYAGSAGREYQSEHGRRGALPIDPDQKEILESFNCQLSELLELEDNRVFTVIGSGVQFKHGQTTVSRQDIHRSISEEQSHSFKDAVEGVMRAADPNGQTLTMTDTGKDMEIVLTVDGGREFTKGDGAAFLDRELGLRIEGRNCLVCGDTASDLAMAEYVTETAGPDRVKAVFVTGDETLKERARTVAPGARFASAPDVLVAALHAVAK